MNIKEQIRAEIDKRYAEYRAKMKTDDFTYYEGMADALDLFEQYIDTFPEQPEVDLEKEVETYFKGWYMDETDQGCILHTPDDHAGLMSVKQVARHFAEWGSNHLRDSTKMIPNGLEEAAENIYKTPYGTRAEDFKAGAEWMAGQRWISVDERLPKEDEEVIALTDELGTAPIYKIAFGHIVDVERCIDYNGWNIPGVKYWMPCPEIPNND